MRAMIVVLLCAGCSSGSDAHTPEAAKRLAGELQSITDLACGACTRCEGERCDQCEREINQRLAAAMQAAVGPLGHGRSISEVASFDELALPDEIRATVKESHAKTEGCYATIRARVRSTK
jgi:hypothetical protein